MESPIAEIISSSETTKRELEKRIQERVSDKLDFLLDKLFELAEGVSVLYRTPDGAVTKAYKMKPDADAAKYLIDRIIGKPTQQTEQRIQSQGIIQVEHFLKQLGDGNPKSLPVSEGSRAETFSE